MPKSTMKSFDWLACASMSIFILIGVVLLGVGLRNFSYGIAATNWPTASGFVRDSVVSTKTSQGSHGRGSSTMHIAEITFVFEVDGNTYTTRRIHFGQDEGSADRTDAELYRLRYPEGAQVTISYNPSNPWLAVARPGFHPDVLFVPGAGLAFGLSGLMFLLIYLGGFKGYAVEGLGWRLFAGIFLLLGIWMLSVGWTNLQRAHESPHWPTVPGIVLAPREQSDSYSNGNDEDYLSSEIRGIIYRYSVEGKKYFSDVRRFGQFTQSSTGTQKGEAESYQGGAKVRIAYDPSHPEIAVLEPGIDSEAYWLPGAGAACVVFALGVLFVLRRLGK